MLVIYLFIFNPVNTCPWKTHHHVWTNWAFRVSLISRWVWFIYTATWPKKKREWVSHLSGKSYSLLLIYLVYCPLWKQLCEDEYSLIDNLPQSSFLWKRVKVEGILLLLVFISTEYAYCTSISCLRLTYLPAKLY